MLKNYKELIEGIEIPATKIEDYEKRRGLCQRVFDYCRRNFTYQFDEVKFGLKEYWAMPEETYDRYGMVEDDCDGFAIYSRLELWLAGVRNRLVYCFTETDVAHLICEADGYCFDNRQQQLTSIKQLTNTGYKWISMSGYSPGDSWTRIESADSSFLDIQ